MKRRGIVLSAAAAAMVTLALAGGVLVAQSRDRTVHVQVRRFEYIPGEIRLKRGVPVVLELESLDVPHGFNAPDLGIRTDVIPGKPATVRLVPQKAGRFSVHCDIFCGTGHENLFGAIVVEP